MNEALRAGISFLRRGAQAADNAHREHREKAFDDLPDVTETELSPPFNQTATSEAIYHTKKTPADDYTTSYMASKFPPEDHDGAWITSIVVKPSRSPELLT